MLRPGIHLHIILKILFPLFLAVLWIYPVKSQTGNEPEDSLQFRKYDIFPAISYSPETKLTLGVIGFRYLDLSKKNLETTRSFINFVAVYTTADQIILETNWDLFTDGNDLRFLGTMIFTRFPDRNYGKSNDAGALVYEYEMSYLDV